MGELVNYFEKFLKQDGLFVNKKALQTSFTPDNIVHREDQIDVIAKILAPLLRNEKPSNLFIYGKTGTGKTVSVRYVTNKILEVAHKNTIPLQIHYINCKLKKVADTEYRLIAQLTRDIASYIFKDEKKLDKYDVPSTGLPTDEVYDRFYSLIDQKGINLVIILDEIDELVKKTGSDILYNLTRINSELKKAQISIIGISNNLMFIDNIDPRVKSSLSEEEIVFPTYNAIQIQDILQERISLAFKKDVIEEGLIEKCAAYAAREHGDARRALELLRVAGELAERKNEEKITIQYLDEAESKIEHDKVIDSLLYQPKQYQALLFTIYTIHENITGKSKPVLTGDVYDLYKEICKKVRLRPLTQRRVSDIISELDMLGLISAKIISKGRYGRTREICMDLPKSLEKKCISILKKSLDLN